MSIPETGDLQSSPPPPAGGPALPPRGPVRLFRWYDLLWLILIVFLGQFIPGVIAGIVGLATGALSMDTGVEGLPPSVVMGAVAGSGIVMLLGAQLLRRARRIGWATLGFRAAPLRCFAAAVIAFAVYLAVVETINRLSGLDPEGMLARELMNDLVPADASVSYILLAVAFIGIIVPAVEELIFRGMLITWLAERSGTIAAVVLSALGFSIVHFYFVATEFEFGIFVTAQIFALGLLLGWLFVWSRSIWPPILLHVVNNIVVVAAAVWGAPV
jgi:membrane protease YdiL (CAAX protease family)